MTKGQIHVTILFLVSDKRIIMNVLMLCYEYPPLGGGGAKVVDGLTKELVRDGES
jgi:hypothetical protein